jgi:hypothetical protein
VVLDGGGHGMSTAMMMPQQQPVHPTSVQAPATGMQPAPAWTPPATNMPPAGPPAFLQQPGPATPPPQQFGMQANPAQPNPEMMAALDQAINFGQKPNGS